MVRFGEALGDFAGFKGFALGVGGRVEKNLQGRPPILPPLRGVL